MEIRKGIDTKAKYDGHCASEFLFEVISNNMVSGDDSDSSLTEELVTLIKNQAPVV